MVKKCKIFANNIKTFRLVHGASQRELGHILGCRGPSICDWENNNLPILKRNIKNIELILGKSFIDLKRFDYSDDWERKPEIIIRLNEYRSKNKIKSHDSSEQRAVKLTYQGRTMTLAQWAKELGTSYNVLWYRYSMGLSVEKILSK